MPPPPETASEGWHGAVSKNAATVVAVREVDINFGILEKELLQSLIISFVEQAVLGGGRRLDRGDVAGNMKGALLPVSCSAEGVWYINFMRSLQVCFAERSVIVPCCVQPTERP